MPKQSAEVACTHRLSKYNAACFLASLICKGMSRRVSTLMSTCASKVVNIGRCHLDRPKPHKKPSEV